MKKTKFKQTEIGKIPEDWEIKKVGDLFKVFAGRDLSKLTFSKNKDNEYKYPIYSNSLNDKGLYGFSKTYQYDPECVTVTGRGEVGRAECRREPFNAIVRLLVLKPKEELSCYFVASFINSKLDFSHVGSAVNQLTAPEISERIITIPPFIEQSAIAKILSDLDFKIELNQQMNKTLEAIGQAIFKHWFIGFEFPNEKGKPYKSSGGEMVDSELGEIPKGWSIKELPEIALVIDCLHTKKPEQTEQGKVLLQFYNLNKIHNVDLSNPYFVSDEDYVKWAKNIEVMDGDILFTNAARQAIAKVPYWFKGGIGRNITAIRPKIDSAYLLEYFLSEYGKEQITKNTDQGTIFSSLNVKGIRKLKILTPPNELIKQYSSITGKLRFKIEINEEGSVNLSKIRDSLLPRLMSGKIRVPVEVG